MTRISLLVVMLTTVLFCTKRAQLLAADATAKATVVRQAEGIVKLIGRDAVIHGKKAYVRSRIDTGYNDVCNWTNPKDWVSWQFALKQPGEYVVELRYSCADGSEGSQFKVAIGDAQLTGKIGKPTGDWNTYRSFRVGNVKLDETGEHTLSIKPLSKPGTAVMNLYRVRLIPTEDYESLVEAEKQNPLHGFNRPIIVIPDFHPASCGWLTDFSTERNYCAYSYLQHLDRLRKDPTYDFPVAEVNNLMAILCFEPEQFEELKRFIHEGRVEACNGFFLEPTINLSGGEALVKCGVEGLRWQQQVLGVRPRFAWMIDVCGIHEQMGQIASGLGLEAMVYCRYNPTNSIPHWLQSPDGSRILSLASYYQLGFTRSLLSTTTPLRRRQIEEMADAAIGKGEITPAPLPIYILGSAGDYSLPPKYRGYTHEFVEMWNAMAPRSPVSFSGPGKYLDAILPSILSGKVQLPTSTYGTSFGHSFQTNYSAFWINCPRVKTLYRRSEHALQAAEAVSAIASLQSTFDYPVAPLNHSWLLMLLNMDRNTLWGAAGGMVFENKTSWDVLDRFNKVQEITSKYSQKALKTLLGEGKAIGIFNPMNDERTAPFMAKLPEGTTLAGAVCQSDADGKVLCRLNMSPFSAVGIPTTPEKPYEPKQIAVPAKIETRYYTVQINPQNGALASLKLKPSGREVLAGPVLIVAERGSHYHRIHTRPNRRRLFDSSAGHHEVEFAKGPLATVVKSRGEFYGGREMIQTIHFYSDVPRIDFEVTTENIPAKTAVAAEFPLAGVIQQTRRGIPYGFSHGTHGPSDPSAPGLVNGILPAIRWSDYVLTEGGGVALLDRGLPGRELDGNTALLYLMNAHDTYIGYRCDWLSGNPRQSFQFALYAHEAEWESAHVPQLAWEYNCPPLMVEGVKETSPKSFVETSDNVLVESLRREDDCLELRLVECQGRAGHAKVTLAMPVEQGFVTDLTGAHAKPLSGGATYGFPVRPQEIVTLRFKTRTPVEEVKPLLKWDDLVPPAKLLKLLKKLPNANGHPPLG